MIISEEAVKLHGCGYNCAQCVLKACREFYPGIDDNVLSRVAAGFVGGVNCGQVCGALTGAVMALGLAQGFDDNAVLKSKADTNLLTKLCVEDFKNKYNSILCSELKGGEYICNELIAYGAELTVRLIKKQMEKKNGNL